MNIEYIRNLTGSYMIIKDAEYQYENSELLMLLNNKIPGLLDLQVIISDGKMEYWYEITGTNSLGTMLDLFSLEGKRLKRLIEDIYDVNQQLKDYLLDGENVQYFPEMIYYDRGTETYRFCYLPGSKAMWTNSLQSLAEYMLPKIDHKDTDAVTMGYAFYDKCLQECCSAEELLSCVIVREKEEKIIDAAPDQTEVTPTDSMPLSRALMEQTMDQEADSEKEKKGFLGRRSLNKRRKNQIKTTPSYEQLLAEVSQMEVVAEPVKKDFTTVFLNIEKHIEIGKLVYQGEGREQNFVLEEDSFLIGKDEQLANGVLRADTVSRIHARIFRQEGCYYIEDLNSTNGTYLNGKELYYHEPVKLESLDRIVFATEEYVFS